MADGYGRGHRWPDPLTRALAECDPHSELFADLARHCPSGAMHPNDYFAAADIGGVLIEHETDPEWVASKMDVPAAVLEAVARGWHRPTLRGLMQVAYIMEVPLAAFLVTPTGEWREGVERYWAYRSALRQTDFR